MREMESLSEDERQRSIIKCECGAEILLLPDSKAMDRAIEVHVAEHRKKAKDVARAAADASRIRNILIAQVLKKAEESGSKLAD
jgi:hypothetical protein